MNTRHLKFSGYGDMGLTLSGPIQAVGIENIADVESHEISREAGATLHLIQFRGGGQFRFLYTDEGVIHACNGTPFNGSLSLDNRLVVRAPLISPPQKM